MAVLLEGMLVDCSADPSVEQRVVLLVARMAAK